MSKERLGFDEYSIINKLNKVNDYLRINGISTDIDSTEFASEISALQQFNVLTGQKRKLSEITDRYVMVKWLTELNYKDPLKEAISIWNNPKELSNLQLSPGSLILSKYFNESKIELHRVTARPGWPEIINSTHLCYRSKMPWVNVHLLHMQKGMSINPGFKYETVPIYAKYHFDDAQEELEILASMGITGVLIPQPWNEHYKPKDLRVLTFDDAMQNGIPSLGMSKFSFINTPKMLQAYFVLSDYILRTGG